MTEKIGAQLRHDDGDREMAKFGLGWRVVFYPRDRTMTIAPPEQLRFERSNRMKFHFEPERPGINPDNKLICNRPEDQLIFIHLISSITGLVFEREESSNGLVVTFTAVERD